MREGTTIVSCPYCGEGNEIDIEKYQENDWEDLRDLCGLCGNMYNFVIEKFYKTRSFKN